MSRTAPHRAHTRDRIAAICVLLVVDLLIGGVSPAHAYIDPGTGAMVLQLVVAAGLAAAYYVFRTGSRIREWFRSLFRRGKARPLGGK